MPVEEPLSATYREKAKGPWVVEMVFPGGCGAKCGPRRLSDN